MTDDRRRSRVAKTKFHPPMVQRASQCCKMPIIESNIRKYRNRIRTKRCTEVADLGFIDSEFFGRDIGDRNRSDAQNAAIQCSLISQCCNPKLVNWTMPFGYRDGFADQREEGPLIRRFVFATVLALVGRVWISQCL